MGRKRNTSQSYFFKKKFDYSQYWLIEYSANISGSVNNIYRTILKANSSACARKFFLEKINDDDIFNNIMIIQIYMFHRDSKIDGYSLDIQDWECIRDSAFPNTADHLFYFKMSNSNDLSHSLC